MADRRPEALIEQAVTIIHETNEKPDSKSAVAPLKVGYGPLIPPPPPQRGRLVADTMNSSHRSIRDNSAKPDEVPPRNGNGVYNNGRDSLESRTTARIPVNHVAPAVIPINLSPAKTHDDHKPKKVKDTHRNVPTSAGEWLGTKTSYETGQKLLALTKKGDWLAVETLLRQMEKGEQLPEIPDDETGMTPLMYAIRDNRVFIAEKLMEVGMSINSKAKDGTTTLHLAATNGREDMLRVLMNRKADPNIIGGQKTQLPIHILASRNTGAVIVPLQLLLRSSPKEARMQTDRDGNIPLFLAVECGNHGACKELLSALAKEQVTFRHPVTGQTVLHIVTTRKDVDLLRYFLECGGDLDIQDNQGVCPLHIGAKDGDENIVKLFHQHHANPNLQDKYERTPLHLAAEKGHTTIVEMLVDKFKASVFQRTKDGSTLMHVAAAAGHPATALVFIRKGVPLHMPNKAGAKCIHMAAKRGHVDVVKTLLQKGEHVDSMNNENYTALHIAVQAGQPEVVETLLGFGAQVQLKAGDQAETPLHISARTDHGERCAEMLIKSGADVNAIQIKGESPLHYASSHGHLKTVKLLLEDDANLAIKSNTGETPLHVAVKNCHYPVVEVLIEHLKKKNKLSQVINEQNNDGETTVHYAARLTKEQIHSANEDAEMMKLLLQVGGDVTKETYALRETPVHYCSRSGNLGVLQEIIDSLPPFELQRAVNKQAKNGWSPLLYACEAGHPSIVRLLLLHHARVDVFDEGGKAALHLAAEYGRLDAVEILLAHKAFVNVRSKEGLTPLHVAAKNGFNPIVRKLVDTHSASLDALTLRKQTPLHLAAEQGRLEVCSSLLEMKADANATDNYGQTPLLLAAENDHSEVVKLFLRHKPELVSMANTKGFTCAHIAAMKGSVAVVKELMKSNRTIVTLARNKVKAKRFDIRTRKWSHFASLYKDYEQTQTNSTALHLAAEGGHAGVVQVLLEAGASATDENEEGYTALHLAARHGHTAVLDALRSAVSWKLVSKKTGLTALHVAASCGQTDFVREMLTQVPATVSSEPPVDGEFEDYGLTPLHLASESGHEGVVRMLLNSDGVLADAETKNVGTRALHLAAAGGHIAVAGLLLSRSADQLHAKDKQGRTPLHMAAANGHKEFVGMLLGQGADINLADNMGKTALHYTADKGFLDVLKLLVDSGASPMTTTLDGKVPLGLAAAAGHYHIITYLLHKEHDTVTLLEDKSFLLDMMIIGKTNQNKPVCEFVLVSPAPIDTAVKLANSYQNLSIREKDRAKDLEHMATYCQTMAYDLLSISASNNDTALLLRAVDYKSTPFLDVLIELEQKDVVAHAAVQRYLSEIWMGNLTWSTWKMVLLFIAFVFCPLTWVLCSLPLCYRFSSVPIIKFMSYLVSHIFFTVVLSFTLMSPWNPLWKSIHLIPNWHEWLLIFWLVGITLADITNPKDRGGLGWVRVVIIVVSTFAFATHLLAFAYHDTRSRLTLLYIRNQFLAIALLLSFLEFLNFLTFHHLFGPWAVIIRDLMKDLLRFLAILAIFLTGFSLHLCAVYQPVFQPPDVSENGAAPPLAQDFYSPISTFEMLFYALFGLVEPDYMPPMHLSPPFAKIIVKVVFGVYMMVTVVVLINLLIAMMSNTYQRIQAQSDTEWKFGRAKLIRNMNNTSPAPPPLNILTAIPDLFQKCQKKGNETGPRSKNTVLSIATEASGRHIPWYKRRFKRQHVIPLGGSSSNNLLNQHGKFLSQVINWSSVTEKYLELTGVQLKLKHDDQQQQQRKN